MEYIFIFDENSNGWWLKIDSVEKLADYHEKTGSGRYDGAMEMYLREGHPSDILSKLNMKERIEKMQDKNFKRLQAAVMQAEKGGRTIFDGFRCLNIEVGMGQMRTLEQYGAIYINCVGGYTFGLQYRQFYLRKELIFPNFKESDIHIKRYGEGGNHYYAFIGDMQVREGDKLKWNTRDEAYNMALRVLG